YADGTDLSRYGPLNEAVAAWEAEAEESRLFYQDDGGTLRVEDTRKGAAARVVTLSGVERALFLFCDHYRAWKDIVKEADTLGWTEAEAERFFQELRARRLAVRADGRWLALALRAARPAVALDAGELDAIREKVRTWGEALTDRERALLGELLGEAIP